jgi:hypothetical protein
VHKKGAPILRPALTSGLPLELTYRDLSVQERLDELHSEEQAQHNVEVSAAAEYETSESLQLTTHTLAPGV